jgi:hypothetical protein
VASGSISIQTKGGGIQRASTKIEHMLSKSIFDKFDQYGREGVAGLMAATPKEDGSTAGAWTYEVRHTGGLHQIIWKNAEMAGSTPVVILLQYGHGTGTGGYVQGRDFINPVIVPLFERIRADFRKAVSAA